MLMASPDTEVWLLIRADSATALAGRLKTLIDYWGWQDDQARCNRVHGVAGDSTKPAFGLEPDAFERLAGCCTHIIHCAGTVRMNLALEDARQSAVGSAEQILALARSMRKAGVLAKIDFVSTVGVAGRRPGTLPEEWLDRPPAFHNTYEQAKAEAEVLVRAALEDERLPITVHRPSMVVGDSRDGRVIHFQIFYFLCEFLSGKQTLGLYPDFADFQLDLIPADVVAGAILAASQDPSTVGRIFHLCSGPALAPTIEEVKALVRQAFVRHHLPVPGARSIPLRWYAGLARLGCRLAPADRRAALSTLPTYLDYLGERQSFGNAAFSHWAATALGRLPRWQDYVPRVLDYYLARRH